MCLELFFFFAQTCILTEHRWFHTWEIYYNCDVCRNKIAHQIILTGHMRIHPGEKPYNCDLWGKDLHINVY